MTHQGPAELQIREAKLFCKVKLDEHKIDSSSLDADLLLTKVLGVKRMYLYAHPEQCLNNVQQESLMELLKRRLKGEPMAYICGEREFFGHSFVVNPHVLIPRPETELLVETALQHLDSIESCNVLEVGTGSACISISLSLERPDANIIAWDLCPKALKVAEVNNEKLGAKVAFLKCDALDQESWAETGIFDILVSNPPYIGWDEYESLKTGVKDFEPHQALFADSDGLAFYEAFANYGRKALKADGLGIFEIGHTQAFKITRIFKKFGWNVISVIKDYKQHDRLVIVSNSRKT